MYIKDVQWLLSEIESRASPNVLSAPFQVYQQVLNDQGQALIDSLIASVVTNKASLENVQSDAEFNKLLHRINGVCATTTLLGYIIYV